ncbi:MAG: single-stranded-DNA-specific exonuclease RecJ, partial [Clostridia bacterium]
MNIKKTFNKNFDSETIVKMSKQFNLDAKIIELLFSRGVDTQEKVKSFLSPTKQDILDSFLLNDMQLLVDRINQAIKSNEKVLIFGDYDVDGICATAIMIKLFEHFGKKVDYFLPNRFIDGYGLTNEVIDKIKIQFNPSLIITVDCGISCWKEVEYAKSVGIEIAITDHHEISEKLPETIVVNAKIENQKYPFKFLCGAGLAYKIAYAFLGYEDSIELLTIATFATIADIVPLLSENRTLVSLGLKYLPTHLPLGLKSLIKKNKLDISNLTSSDISYKLAPKINASGRMGEASDSLDLILENNPLKIKEIIEKINSHNLNRQDLCNKVFAEAVDLLKEKNMSKIRCIILKSDKWDSGILGIIAARLVDMFNRPTFLFSETDGELKGSGRSLENINIHEMLTSSSELLSTFGGHTMAAGLSLSAKNYDAFCEKIDKYMQINVNDMLLEKNAYYDLDVTPNELTPKFLNDLNRLEPFGCENQKPLVKLNSQNFSIFPLKKFPQHANIEFDKKI